MKQKIMKKSAAPVKSKALVKISTVDVQNLVSKDQGLGQETMTRQDFAIPRLSILQALSPQCQRKGEGYVDGAEPGMIYENINHNLFDGDDGVLVVPVSYRRTIIEWRLRSDGGGFVADCGQEDALLANCKQNAQGQMINVKGNELLTTAEYYVMILIKGEDPLRAVLSMSRTQLKHSRRWNTMINQLTITTADGQRIHPAMFYRSYELKTQPESNDKGSWFGWQIEPATNVLDLSHGGEIYLSAREFYKAVSSGMVKVADPVEDAPQADDDQF